MSMTYPFLSERCQQGRTRIRLLLASKRRVLLLYSSSSLVLIISSFWNGDGEAPPTRTNPLRQGTYHDARQATEDFSQAGSRHRPRAPLSGPESNPARDASTSRTRRISHFDQPNVQGNAQGRVCDTHCRRYECNGWGVQVLGQLERSMWHLACGTVIAPGLVLTAGHCFGIDGNFSMGSDCRTPYACFQVADTSVFVGIAQQSRQPKYDEATNALDFVDLQLS